MFSTKTCRIAVVIPGVMMLVLVTIFLLVTGIWYFRKTERTFADVI